MISPFTRHFLSYQSRTGYIRKLIAVSEIPPPSTEQKSQQKSVQCKWAASMHACCVSPS